MRVLIVDSADPDFFVAHADVALIMGLATDDTGLHDELSPFNAAMERFRTLPKATIAVIEGIARGGGSEWAMAFDMRYAALGKALFAQPEVAVGIIPGGGGTQRLPRLVGRGRALEVILGWHGRRRRDRRSLGIRRPRAAGRRASAIRRQARRTHRVMPAGGHRGRQTRGRRRA